MQKFWQNPIFLIIGSSVFIGVIIWGLVVASEGPATNTQPIQSEILAEESTYDFGTVSMSAGVVEHIYQLKNGGGQPIELGELYTSCMCTQAQVIYNNGEKSRIAGMKGHGAPLILRQSIPPGETFQIKTIYNPAAHGPQGVGPAHREIYLETNSKTTPVIKLGFDVNVVS